MVDVDWFLSLLNKSDMVNICRRYKLTVVGFQRNLYKAPIKTLGSTLKTALNNGFKKKKTNRKDHLPFEELFQDSSNDLLQKNPNISEQTFIEFAVHAELEPNWRLYEILSIAVHLFPKEFEEHYDAIVNNTKEGRYIFYGLTEELSKTSLEKIYQIVDVDNLQKRNIDILKKFVASEYYQKFRGNFPELDSLIGEVDTTFRLLSKADNELHVYILAAFLLKGERYNDEMYKDLFQITVLNIEHHKIEQLKQEVEDKEHDIKSIKIELQEHLDEKIKLIEENANLVTSLNVKIENVKQLENKLVDSTEKVAELKSMLTRNEPIRSAFDRIIEGNNIIVVTKDVGHFTGTPFENVTILPSQFKKNLKEGSTQFGKAQTIFITRSSFSNGTDWYRFKQLLEKNQLPFEELGQYDIASYIQEIIQHLSRKEVLIYADEI